MNPRLHLLDLITRIFLIGPIAVVAFELHAPVYF